MPDEKKLRFTKATPQTSCNFSMFIWFTFSTGINIRNLNNIVFASPSKSRIRNLQSIGRGLRKSEVKTKCNLFDIGDDLSWKQRKNYTLNHLLERIKMYNEETFDYKVVKVDSTI